MKLLAKTFPVLLIKIGCAQTPADHVTSKIDYGYTASTFTGITANNFIRESHTGDELLLLKYKPLATSDYGWKQGLFFWINISPCFAFRPEVNAIFSVSNHKNRSSRTDKMIYSTSAGIEFKPQFIFRLGCWNSQPIIRLARNMSYYLEGKQAYFIIGPKISYQKSDRAFRKINNDKNTSVGIVLGGGVDNLFLNLNVAPELLFSLEYKTGNKNTTPDSSNRYYASMSLAMNFF